MAEDQIAKLKKARQNLIEERNNAASDLAGKVERSVFWTATENLVKIHSANDAIDPALQEYGRCP